ncbi:MAG: hypothetical protein GX258_03310 [Clostridiales bacterium]|nr:hypothetical protein [Clostridiales bacterium]
MLKKILPIILSATLAVSIAGCSNSTKNSTDETSDNKTKMETKEEAVFIGEGEWAKDYTREEVSTFHSEILARMEEEALFYGLEYKIEEKVEEENGETVNDNHIYLDNLNPEPNRLESMYYGFKIFGEDLSKGSLNLKMGFKLDLEQIKDEEKFDFKETSMSSFSEAMTNDFERDYSDINNQIIDIVKNQDANGTIETNLNGFVETITIKDDYLLYKLDSKLYDFSTNKN